MQTDTLLTYLIERLNSALALLPKLAVTDDPEDLHRYRVALRRSRSLLSLYEPDFCAIEAILKTLFKPTNTLRELDVLLLSIERLDYPELYRELDDYRNTRYGEILTTGYITRSRSVLEQLIEELKGMETHNNDRKLVKKARKHAEHTDKAYNEITSETRPKTLHAIRIAYKTVRYSLEFLKESGLDYRKKSLKEAKQRQEELGTIQDAANQLSILRKFCDASALDECKHLYKVRKRAYKELVRKATSNR